MASKRGPEQSRRDDLSPRLGEDPATWARRIQGTAVMHPDLLAQEQARQDEARARSAARSRQRLRRSVGWLLAAVLSLVIVSGLHQAAGLSWWLVAVSAAAAVLGARAVARASQLQRSGDSDAITAGPAPGENQLVRLSELDDSCRALMLRARKAIAELLPAAGDPGNLIDEVRLREDEWNLAVVLRDVSRLRFRHAADPVMRPDAASGRALEARQDKAVTWVQGLEALSAQCKATRMAKERFQEMDKARRLQDAGLDIDALIAAKAEPAIARIAEVTKGLAELQEYFEGKPDEDI